MNFTSVGPESSKGRDDVLIPNGPEEVNGKRVARQGTGATKKVQLIRSTNDSHRSTPRSPTLL
jgi:hypothetical protein